MLQINSWVSNRCCIKYKDYSVSLDGYEWTTRCTWTILKLFTEFMTTNRGKLWKLQSGNLIFGPRTELYQPALHYYTQDQHQLHLHCRQEPNSLQTDSHKVQHRSVVLQQALSSVDLSMSTKFTFVVLLHQEENWTESPSQRDVKRHNNTSLWKWGRTSW